MQPVPKSDILVYWEKPSPGSIKLNTGGSFLHESNKAGIGGVLRYDNTDLIMAFSIPSSCNSNNSAEVQAALFGLNWCYQNGFRNFTIELDSLLITNI
ncbi:hypothetical protein BC332_28359 [Capsicum chinense]|nr:hypothetical protein BC332_28359 [Capsicum chinense]